MVGYDCAVSVLLVAAVQNSASGVQRVHHHSPGQKGVNNCHNIDTRLVWLPRQALAKNSFRNSHRFLFIDVSESWFVVATI